VTLTPKKTTLSASFKNTFPFNASNTAFVVKVSCLPSSLRWCVCILPSAPPWDKINVKNSVGASAEKSVNVFHYLLRKMTLTGLIRHPFFIMTYDTPWAREIFIQIGWPLLKDCENKLKVPCTRIYTKTLRIVKNQNTYQTRNILAFF